ncbi:MAG: class I SAM-dependent methyltransferase [Anaerolineae bacterium]|nr:class I SAM-dependent methyltransferase [Anaerolineae bacterium]
MINDKVAVANQKLWEDEVKKGCGYTIPWLDLDVATLHQYIDGEYEFVPDSFACMYPASILTGVEGKDVLCLASGGGQQSAVFGLLGARVTVVDLAEGQLEGDRKAAAHYGYDVTTLHADMRDLSCLPGQAFDLVYGTGLAYVPDVRQVYAGVARVLRTGGLFRVDFGQPAVYFTAWDGAGYRIVRPYAERVNRRADGAIEFRHYMDDIFNGLLDLGFSIQRVCEAPYYEYLDPDASPGSWPHEQAYVAGRFAIVARKD